MEFTDIDDLKSILESEAGISITSLARVANPGEVNDVFIIDTADSKLIARVNESDELNRFEKEEWCIEAAENVGVLVPAVNAIGHTANYAYLLESYIEGSRGDKLKDPSQAWSKIGQYAKAIHSIGVKGFGESLSNITHGSRSEWDKYLEDNLRAREAKNEAFIEASGLAVTDMNTVFAWINDFKDRDLQFGLSHGDLSLMNVIVSETGNVNLIDWGAAEAHIVPHYDLGVILEDSLSDDSEDFRNVLQGYQMTYDEYLAIKPDILTLMLLIAVDKLRWAIDKRLNHVSNMSEHLRHCYQTRQKLTNQ